MTPPLVRALPRSIPCWRARGFGWRVLPWLRAAAIGTLCCAAVGSEANAAGTLLSVGNTAQLRALPSTQTSAVTRLGYAKPGDAPPLLFYPSSSACSIAGGDGGSQVPSADGKCWLAQFPAGGADAREWGMVMDGATDNRTTFQVALSWAGTGNNKLIFPPGTVYSSTLSTLTIAAGGSATVAGAGSDQTFFKGPATGGVDFLHIIENGASQSFHLRDFSCLATAPAASMGTCVNAIQTGAIASPAATALSDITNVTFRGADGYAGSYCWSNDVELSSVSNVNFIGDAFSGCSTPIGAGIALFGSSSTHIGVVFNVTSSNFIGIGWSIYYGSYTQGVTISQSNFTSDTYGVFVPVGAVGQAQLTLTASQCGYVFTCLCDNVGVPGLIVTGNLIYASYSADIGVQLVSCLSCIVSGNAFEGLATANTTGIVAGGVNGNVSQGTITGNTFYYLQYGVNIVTYGNYYVGGNAYVSNVTTPLTVASTATRSQLVDAPVLGASTPVSGAVSGAGSVVKLTVSSTANFVNRQKVLVSGVGGIPGISVALFAYISIVDATHLLLTDVLFAGAYTSGGFVQAFR